MNAGATLVPAAGAEEAGARLRAHASEAGVQVAQPVLARTTARLLHACAGAAGSTGLLCAAGALAALLLRAPGAAPAAVMLALVLALLPLERLLWLRVRFDAGLFTDLAGALSHRPGRVDPALDAGTALDAALGALRLRRPATASGAAGAGTPAIRQPRSLIDRALGARRLAQWHALVALAQFALLVSALALRFLQ